MKRFLIAAMIAFTGMTSVSIPAAHAVSSVTITTGDDGIRIRNRERRNDRRHIRSNDRREMRRHREIRRSQVRDNCRTKTVKQRRNGKVIVKTVKVCG